MSSKKASQSSSQSSSSRSSDKRASDKRSGHVHPPRPPLGYVLHKSILRDFNKNETLIELLLPTKVKADLDRQAYHDGIQKALAEIEQEREEEARLNLVKAAVRAKDLKDTQEAEDRLRARLAPGETVIDMNTGKSITAPELDPLSLGTDLAYDPKRSYPVYTAESLIKLVSRSKVLSAFSNERKRDDDIASKLTTAGVLRDIAMPDNVLATLDELRFGQPHFGAVIDLIQGQLLLASRTGKCLRIPPMLLDGEPGLGKTHFAYELAKVLGTTVRRISFDNAINSSTLTGSDRRWSNSQHGALFDLVCLGQHANPIVILDEIDKTNSQHIYDPLAPLHTLLEPSTAKFVRDISVDFEFDASMVTWIATSNKRVKLPDSLRSRFREFHITQPDAHGAIQLAMAVVAKTFADMALPDFESPAKAIAVSLAHLTAREIHQAMEQALAHAVANGRHRVTPEDLPDELRQEDGHSEKGLDSNRSYKSGKASKTWLH
ncbi:MAG: AAA family ATPase [Burkholderiaceae bacterium]|nr:AAA family ATPase [Burkholderiaceae bacterium]